VSNYQDEDVTVRTIVIDVKKRYMPVSSMAKVENEE
jgi:hypothetical protein